MFFALQPSSMALVLSNELVDPPVMLLGRDQQQLSNDSKPAVVVHSGSGEHCLGILVGAAYRGDGGAYSGTASLHSVLNSSLPGTTAFTAPDGVARFPAFRLQAPAGNHSVAFTLLDYPLVPPLNVTMVIRPCEMGEYQQQESSLCVLCPETTHVFVHTGSLQVLVPTMCTTCPMLWCLSICTKFRVLALKCDELPSACMP